MPVQAGLAMRCSVMVALFWPVRTVRQDLVDESKNKTNPIKVNFYRYLPGGGLDENKILDFELTWKELGWNENFKLEKVLEEFDGEDVGKKVLKKLEKAVTRASPEQRDKLLGHEVLGVFHEDFHSFRYFVWSPDVCLDRGELQRFTTNQEWLNCDSFNMDTHLQETFKLEKGLVKDIAFGLELELIGKDHSDVKSRYPHGVKGWDFGAADDRAPRGEINRKNRRDLLQQCYANVTENHDKKKDRKSSKFEIKEDRSVRSINEFTHARSVQGNEKVELAKELYAKCSEGSITPADLNEKFSNLKALTGFKIQVSEVITQHYLKTLSKNEKNELSGIGFEIVGNGAFTGSDSEMSIRQMLATLKHMGVQANPSGSVHVHLNLIDTDVAQAAGGSTVEPEGLIAMFTAWAKYQVAINTMMLMTRRARPYAKPLWVDDEGFRSVFHEMHQQVMNWKKSGTWKTPYDFGQDDYNWRGTFTGPTAHNTVEVRQSSADYNPEFVLRWIQFLQGFMKYFAYDKVSSILDVYFADESEWETMYLKLVQDMHGATIKDLFGRLNSEGLVDDDSLEYFENRIQSVACDTSEEPIRVDVVDYGEEPDIYSWVFSIAQIAENKT